MAVSAVMAPINFTPPDTKTLQITKVEGSPRGKKIVSTILKQEIDFAKGGHQGDITRSNYDFAFLREQNFGVVPEYMLHITPKRKERGLLLGDIWVDAKTFRLRQIIGVPLKNPSIWVEDLRITVQFADVNGMWLPVSVGAIATIPLWHVHPFWSRFATLSGCFKRANPLITPIFWFGRRDDLRSDQRERTGCELSLTVVPIETCGHEPFEEPSHLKQIIQLPLEGASSR